MAFSRVNEHDQIEVTDIHQGIRNTLGSLKDELFSDDDWEDDPWANPGRPPARSRGMSRRDLDPWDDDFRR